MKQAADELLGLLQRSEIALDGVARKLDTEFADRFSGAGVRDESSNASNTLKQLQTSCLLLVGLTMRQLAQKSRLDLSIRPPKLQVNPLALAQRVYKLQG